MFFNSYQFLFIFLPIVFSGFWLLKDRYRATLLIVASIIFYSIWSITHLLLLILSIVVNYQFAKRIEINYSKFLLLSAIVINILPLFYFKYMLGVEDSSTVLPLAISFYTFQQIAFLIDLYQKRIILDGFQRYLFFVLLFPQLIAGPIVHYNQLISQIKDGALSRVDMKMVESGIFIFSIGLFKKVAIADTFFALSNLSFGSISTLNSTDAWSGLIGYSLGIYFDFSAYSDMAIGLGLLFGITLPVNFNSPYKASNIIDFWRRWHITLSDFLKNYIYIPLGGNRHGKGREVMSLILTMSIGGVWHGVGWGFLVWGFAHGVLLVIVHLFKNYIDIRYRYISIFITFLTVSLLWVLFRANSLYEAWDYYKILFGYNFTPIDIKVAIELTIGLLIVWTLPNAIELINYPKSERLKWYYALFSGVLMFISLKIMAVSPAQSFVYFNF